MDIKELMDKAAAHVVKMLDGTDGERWDGTSPMYEGFCGWNGVMSPMNRPAFVAKFGEDFTKAAEEEARRIIAARSDFWERSKGKQYEIEANTFEGIGDPGFLVVDSFVWGVMDTLKCDHEDLTECIRNLIERTEEENAENARLCKVIRIEEVEDIERDAATVLRGWKPQPNEGGFASDDVGDGEMGKYGSNYSSLTKEQKRTFYTLAVLVRDKKKRYFLIDPEGYDYPRYVILPKAWEQKFAKTVDEIKAAIKAENEAAEKAKAEKLAADRAAYDERCAKWAPMMEEIPAELKGHEYMSEYRKIGKRNILKMAKAAFPWVRFSVSYDGGWGTGYVLKWKNGPTVEELRKKTDLGLFCPWVDTFDGMTDYADTKSAQFTDFSDKFGGVGNGVKFEREECEKDQNGDPNGKPPAPPKPPKSKGGDVEVKYNEKFNGLEIYFPAIPSENIRNLCKASGYRWSRRGFWYAKKSDRTEAAAEQIVAEWSKENGRAAA